MKEGMNNGYSIESKKPVHLIYGSMDDGSVNQLPRLDKAIKRQLGGRPDGRVVVIFEDPHAKDSIAMGVERDVASGMSPSFSYMKNAFFAKHRRPPNFELKKDMISFKNAFKKFPAFTQAELGILDKYSRNDSIYMLWEYGNEIDDHLYLNYFSNYHESLDRLRSGDLVNGVNKFKMAVANYKKYIDRRGSVLAMRLSGIVEKSEISGAVGYVDPSQSGLRKSLSKRGYKVSREFADRENGVFKYSYFNQAVRSYDRPAKPTEIDWCRWLIGTEIQDDLTAYPEEQSFLDGSPVPNKNIINNVFEIMKKFKSAEAVREFGVWVAQEGYEPALKKAFSQ